MNKGKRWFKTENGQRAGKKASQGKEECGHGNVRRGRSGQGKTGQSRTMQGSAEQGMPGERADDRGKNGKTESMTAEGRDHGRAGTGLDKKGWDITGYARIGKDRTARVIGHD